MTMNTAGGCWWVEGVHDYYVDGALKELKSGQLCHGRCPWDDWSVTLSS